MIFILPYLLFLLETLCFFLATKLNATLWRFYSRQPQFSIIDLAELEESWRTHLVFQLLFEYFENLYMPAFQQQIRLCKFRVFYILVTICEHVQATACNATCLQILWTWRRTEFFDLVSGAMKEIQIVWFLQQTTQHEIPQVLLNTLETT